MQDLTLLMQRFYEKYPYSNLALSEDKITGGWYLNYTHLYYRAHRVFKGGRSRRILDAGCGGGDITVILALNNPDAEVVGVDLSRASLDNARALAEKYNARNLRFEQADIIGAGLPGRFDLIVSSGVIHHFSEPLKGLKKLARSLTSDGIILMFIYSMYGRWEIGIVQEIVNLLENDKTKFEERAALAKKIFKELPADNRISQFFNNRQINQEGAAFADMYINPNENRYNVFTLFDLLDKAGLSFAGFIDKDYWELEKQITDKDLLEKIMRLTQQEKFHLKELLYPDIMGYSLLAKKKECPIKIKTYHDEDLLGVYPLVNPAAIKIDASTLSIGGVVIKLQVEQVNFLPEFNGEQTAGQIWNRFCFLGIPRDSFLDFLRLAEGKEGLMFLDKPLSAFT